MTAPPLPHCRFSGHRTQTRVARALLFALPLGACGGRSHDSQAPRDPVSAGTGGASGTGGTQGASGAPAGGAGTGAGMGGQSNAGAAGAAAQYRAFCWDWSDLENEPKPGQSGIDACPDFNEVKFVVKYTCFYAVPDPAPIPPTPTTTGDCCYAVTDYNCR